MDGEILFLSHRPPFPPDRGDKIRAHHVLKALSAIAPVHVGCLAEGPRDILQGGELTAVSASWCMPRRGTNLPLATPAPPDPLALNFNPSPAGRGAGVRAGEESQTEWRLLNVGSAAAWTS